jgi:hypothetical protein
MIINPEMKRMMNGAVGNHMYFDTVNITSPYGILYLVLFVLSFKFGIIDGIREVIYDRKNTKLEQRKILITIKIFEVFIFKPFSIEQRWRTIRIWIGFNITMLILLLVYWTRGGFGDGQ